MENKKSYKPTILLDLDGALNNYTKYDESSIPEIKKGAKEFLEKLCGKYKLVLFTTRNLLLASKWLVDNEIDIFFSDVSNVKPQLYCTLMTGRYVLGGILITY